MVIRYEDVNSYAVVVCLTPRFYGLPAVVTSCRHKKEHTRMLDERYRIRHCHATGYRRQLVITTPFTIMIRANTALRHCFSHYATCLHAMMPEERYHDAVVVVMVYWTTTVNITRIRERMALRTTGDEYTLVGGHNNIRGQMKTALA